MVMTPEQALEVAADIPAIARKAGFPYPEMWHHNCHGTSLKVLRSGVFGEGRVARGGCLGVGGQHSWIVLGGDVYDRNATIVDCTLWSYDDRVTGIFTGHNLIRHLPHGAGAIWETGRPSLPREPVIRLTPAAPLSKLAKTFLDLLGPLDRTGWAQLANGAMGGWPAGEIIAAMDDTPELRALVPIDILGMVTDRNPGRLYR